MSKEETPITNETRLLPQFRIKPGVMYYRGSEESLPPTSARREKLPENYHHDLTKLTKDAVTGKVIFENPQPQIQTPTIRAYRHSVGEHVPANNHTKNGVEDIENMLSEEAINLLFQTETEGGYMLSQQVIKLAKRHISDSQAGQDVNGHLSDAVSTIELLNHLPKPFQENITGGTAAISILPTTAPTGERKVEIHYYESQK